MVRFEGKKSFWFSKGEQMPPGMENFSRKPGKVGGRDMCPVSNRLSLRCPRSIYSRCWSAHLGLRDTGQM